jgi:hypothetical protein
VLIGLVIVWLLGYPVLLKNVDLSGTVLPHRYSMSP